MEITLKIKGEHKTFVQESVTPKMRRKALEIEKFVATEEESIDKDLKVDDMRYNLIVEAFDRQFTKDELENGLNIEGKKFNEVMYDIIGVSILGYPSRKELEETQSELGKLQAEVEKIGSEKQEKESMTA